MTMVLILLFFYVVQALSESPPPPQDVRVDNGLLSWTPASQDGNVSYSVSFVPKPRENKSDWQEMKDCVQTSLNSCNVTSIRDDSCTPYVNLTARAESLTVHLIKNQNLYDYYGDGVEMRIHFGKEGEQLKMRGDFLGSTTIDDLQPGQRYCVSVQYVRYDEPIGLSTCPLCEVIPPSRLKQLNIIIAIVVSVIFLVVLGTLIAFILLFRLDKIKKWLQLPVQIPPDFNDRFTDLHVPIYSNPPPEEFFNVICVTPRQ